MAHIDVKASDVVRRMIEMIGDDPDRDGLRETPDRVVRSWDELFSGYGQDPKDFVKEFKTSYDQILTIPAIDYFSMCEHHMLPFFGRVSIAILPNGSGKVLGASKYARIVEVYSRRLQIQEQMTQQIASAIEGACRPKGVGVVVEGKHLCMMARGVRQQHAFMRTSCMLGVFRSQAATRAEVLRLMDLGG